MCLICILISVNSIQTAKFGVLHALLFDFSCILIIKNPKIFLICVFSSQKYRELKIQNIQQRNCTEKAGRSKRPVKKDRLAFKRQPGYLVGRLTPKRVAFWALNARMDTILGV